MSTHYICFHGEIRKILTFLTEKSALSGTNIFGNMQAVKTQLIITSYLIWSYTVYKVICFCRDECVNRN